MKFNIRRITSVIASAAMLLSTIGIAAAASYPSPFVKNGVADAAVVYGSTAAPSDKAAAIDVKDKLNALVTTTPSTTPASSSGTEDTYELAKSSTKFQLGRGILDVVSSTVSEDDLPTLLADGTFTDDDNDEFDYVQKLELSNQTFTMFEDSDYKADTPALGMRIGSGTRIMNYSLEFSDTPEWADLPTSDLRIMGKDYYVLSRTTNTTLNLLDSAESTILSEGEEATLTVGGKVYTTSIAYIGTDSVKLIINGETTKSLAETETAKLADGAYVGIKEVLYNSKDTGISKVEFSIGKGKLKLTTGAEVELNENTISGLSAEITTSGSSSTITDGKLSKIKLIWDADEDSFAAEGSEIIIPGFENIKLSYSGAVFPKTEVVETSYDGSNSVILNDFPLKDSTEDINILFWNGTTYTAIGKEAASKFLRTSNTTTLTFDKDTDEEFVSSWTDGSDSESYIVKADNFKIDNNINKTTIYYRKDGVWTEKKEVQAADTVSLGNVDLTVGQIDKVGKAVTLTAGSTRVAFNTLYSNEGLKVYLPWNCAIAGNCAGTGAINLSEGSTTFGLVFKEEDKNENKGAGSSITLTLAGNAATTKEVTVSGIIGGSATSTEIESTDVYRNFIYSPLATEILWDKGGDQYSVKLNYHGEESYGQFFIASKAAVIQPGTGEQILAVMDTEVGSVSTKNLFVVGGSCINTVAAKILGSTTPLCEAAWTAKTSAGAGKYIIKVVASPYATADSGKIAMLVAGYNAADTTTAVAKALEGAKTDVGTEIIGPVTA